MTKQPPANDHVRGQGSGKSCIHGPPRPMPPEQVVDGTKEWRLPPDIASQREQSARKRKKHRNSQVNRKLRFAHNKQVDTSQQAANGHECPNPGPVVQVIGMKKNKYRIAERLAPSNLTVYLGKRIAGVAIEIKHEDHRTQRTKHQAKKLVRAPPTGSPLRMFQPCGGVRQGEDKADHAAC